MNELVAKFFQAIAMVAGLLWSGVCTAECRILPPQKQQKRLPPCHQKQHQQHEQKSDCGLAYDGDIAKQAVAAAAPDAVADFEELPTLAPALSSWLNLLPALWNPPQGPPGSFVILRT